MEEALLAWHDFNVALVTAAAALLGLLFVALSIHIRSLIQPRNAELRSVARTVFLGYVVALAIGFLALLPQTLRALGSELLVLSLATLLPFGLGDLDAKVTTDDNGKIKCYVKGCPHYLVPPTRGHNRPQATT